MEKLPVLLLDDGRDPVYDSQHTQGYITGKSADKGPHLLLSDLDTDMKARQILLLSKGVLEAFLLIISGGTTTKDAAERGLVGQDRKIDD